MNYFEIGMRFPSYKVLMRSLEEFCEQTRCKFWKRDARTIDSARLAGVQKYMRSNLVYYELKYSCIYGGMFFRSKGKNLRIRNPSLKSSGCPAYMRFRISENGDALQLVAINLNHNHELVLPQKKTFKRKHSEDSSIMSDHYKRIEMLKQMDNVEIEQENETDDTLSTSEISDYINVQNDYFATKTDPAEVTFNFSGLIAPVFTPFNNDEERSLNLDAIPEYAQHLVNSGVTGVLVHGTTGQATAMTVKERQMVTETWAQVCAQTEQHLMVQVGGAPLPDVITMAQHAEQLGVNSILCLPELYHTPKTANDLIRYLKIVSQAAPNTPLLYYHIPFITNVNINMGKFLNEVGDTIPTFKGIKFTSTDLEEGAAAVRAHGGRFAVFMGMDTVLSGGFAMGFDSAIAITLNMFAHIGHRILQGFKEGKVEDGQAAQNELTQIVQVIVKHGELMPAMKAAMKIMTSLDLGPTREPFIPLTDTEAQLMEDELKELGALAK